MEAGAIALISGAEARLKLEPLVTQSGAGMGAVPTAAANAGPFEKVALAFKADGKARVVAATVSGNFTSAYPKGAPAPAAEEPARPGEPPKAPVAPPAGPHLAASQKPGRLIIVADSDFMMDPFTVRQRQVGGQVATEPVNDNFGFVISALETLGGSDELVGLRSKGTSLRPFKRVQEIERVAQVRYQAKLDEIERRLEEANAKIADLSRQSGGVTANTNQSDSCFTAWIIASGLSIRPGLRSETRAPIHASTPHHSADPEMVRMLNRINPILKMPAGIEIKCLTTGSNRAKNTPPSSYLCKNRSARASFSSVTKNRFPYLVTAKRPTNRAIQ